MTIPDLVLGLLDTSAQIGDPRVADRFRGLTMSWSRYGYQGDLIEADSVDAILRRAADTAARYCFIQPYGFILYERWQLNGEQPRDFFDEVSAWVRGRRFLLAGTLDADEQAWFGFAPHCLLIQLDEYRQLGQPAFELPVAAARQLPGAEPIYANGRVAELLPTDTTVWAEPRLPGWHLIAASLAADLPVVALGDELLRYTLDLGANSLAQRQAIVPLFGAGIAHYMPREDAQPREDANGLSPDQCRFLNVIKTQTENARRGVFLWNIESYQDVESPSDGFASPVSTLYSVAAGFKPNRILQTHGFTEQTRVVFYDYSQPALDIRKYILAEWDGDDFPRFADQLFDRFPYPETFYQLWNEVTPHDDIGDDIQRIWEQELDRWGGAESFANHWQRYRHLEHHYVCCNILTDPSLVLDFMKAEPNSIIWWSNAFFTMYGNWFYTIEQRRQAYAHWIDELATRNPDLFLLGSDNNNTCVNSIRAGEYGEQYRRLDADGLHPNKLHRFEIRM